jgi:hypothetical protein
MAVLSRKDFIESAPVVGVVLETEPLISAHGLSAQNNSNNKKPIRQKWG